MALASVCISNCVDDAGFPIRPKYVNLYKWPESEAQFVRSVSSCNKTRRSNGPVNHPRVVDSISCRQIYLRSYKFSRKQTVPQKTKRCLCKLWSQKVTYRRKKKLAEKPDQKKKKKEKKKKKKKMDVVFRRAKEVSRASLRSVFRRLLSCTSKIDVVDHGKSQ